MRQDSRMQNQERIHIELPEKPEADISESEKRKRTDRHIILPLCTGLFFLFWCSLLFVVPWDEFFFTPAWVFSHVQDQFHYLHSFLFGENKGNFGITVYQYLAVMTVGAGLSACGAIFQGSFRNVLAGPSTMGVMSGGSLGCLLYLLIFTESFSEVGLLDPTTADLEAYANLTFFEYYAQQICTLLGCFAAVILVLGVSTAAGKGKLSASAMIISGMVFSAVTSNITLVIQYVIIVQDPSDSRIEAIQDLMMGTFNNITTLRTLLLMAVPVLICLAVLLVEKKRMNLLSLSDEEAQTMGINLKKYRYFCVGAGTVITAFVVSFCGHIGFLGFMVPLISRKICGPDLKKLIPVSMLMGAILLTVIYDAARVAGLTDYLNLFTSSIGCCVMAVTLIFRRGGEGNAAVKG